VGGVLGQGREVGELGRYLARDLLDLLEVLSE
jgi:hypothetical protein